MILPGTSQGNEQPGQSGSLRLLREGFRFARGHGEKLGGCEHVPHHIIRTKSSLTSSLADLKNTCQSPLWAKEWSAKAVVNRGSALRPCHVSTVDLGYFYVLAIVNSAAVNI